jgi:hypothetical protein
MRNRTASGARAKKSRKFLLHSNMQPKQFSGVDSLTRPVEPKAGTREDGMDKFSILVALAGFVTIGAVAMFLPI